MKRIPLWLILISCVSFAQTNLNITLLSQRNQNTPGYSNIWGWTSPTGREYAIIGFQKGTSYFDITDGTKPILCDTVKGTDYSHAGLWREIQTWDHYAYVVTESQSGSDSSTWGVQIIDLSPLPDSVHLVRYFSTDIPLKGNLVNAHTTHIRDGYLYVNGGTLQTTEMFDLADPENPVYKGAYDSGYTHDCYVRNDTLYTCNIYTGDLDIVDLHDKSNPLFIARITYPQVSGWWVHNCALSEDGNYLLATDENVNTPGYLSIWDLRTLRDGIPGNTNIQLASTYRSALGGLIHNVYVKGTLAFMSYYRDGIRVVDIADPTDPVMVGSYDCEPTSGAGYGGAWGVYPFFASNKLVISDMEDGLFVVQFNPTQAGRVRGTVRNQKNEPIANASITIGTKTRKTDAVGAYTIGTVSGTYLVKFSAIGYRDTTIEMTLTSGSWLDADVRLKLPGSEGPPTIYNLPQNFPNPFNPVTTILFEIPKPSRVSLVIYNLLGQKIKTLFDGDAAVSNYQVTWDGTNDRGSLVPSGMYFYRLNARSTTGDHEEFTETKRMVLVR